MTKRNILKVFFQSLHERCWCKMLPKIVIPIFVLNKFTTITFTRPQSSLWARAGDAWRIGKCAQRRLGTNQLLTSHACEGGSEGWWKELFKKCVDFGSYCEGLWKVQSDVMISFQSEEIKPFTMPHYSLYDFQ
jgi:hypothetical protein